MRQCPNCKTNNPDDARFCNYCGMRLPESKEETLYSDLDELEEAPKTEFSDQEIEEESEKVIDEAKKLLNPDEKEEKEVFLQEEKKEERKEDEDTDTEGTAEKTAYNSREPGPDDRRSYKTGTGAGTSPEDQVKRRIR